MYLGDPILNDIHNFIRKVNKNISFLIYSLLRASQKSFIFTFFTVHLIIFL